MHEVVDYHPEDIDGKVDEAEGPLEHSDFSCWASLLSSMARAFGS